MSQEYYNVLARSIAAAEKDPAELRSLLYRVARLELRQELYNQSKSISLAEAHQQISALEAAISRFELNAKAGNLLTAANDDNLLASKKENDERAVGGPNESALVGHDRAQNLPATQAYTPEILPPLTYPPPLLASDQWLGPVTAHAEGSNLSVSHIQIPSATSWSTLHLILVAIAAVAILSGLQIGSEFFGLHRGPAHQKTQAAAISAKNRTGEGSSGINPPPNGMQLAGLPLPSFYGIFALSDGRLIDLGTLPITVPNSRIAISAMISTPSKTVVPDGRLQFIAFRSDLADGAPDSTTVRVVARVMHALTFDKQGHAKTTDVQGSWAVRGIAYEMRIAPVSGHPAMILIQPADPKFIFPPGRYALVLGKTAYDFSVAGPITDPDQCLERTDAVDEPVYNECRSP